MYKNTIQPHIICSAKDISAYVLLSGDPARVIYIGEKYLKRSKKIAQNREFTTYTGFYQGRKITVTSTGIGCPSTAIAVEELINAGAKILIRVGTCGGALRKDIKVGSIIIPTAAIREEGTTKEYLPPEFPAVADYSVIQALEKSAQNKNYPYYIGINRTHDAFYGQAKNLKNWGSPFLDPRMKSWEYPVLSSEMECSALFIISLMRGVKSGAILAVNYPPEPLKEIIQGKYKFTTPGTHLTNKEARNSIDRAIKTALDALVLLSVK